MGWPCRNGAIAPRPSSILGLGCAKLGSVRELKKLRPELQVLSCITLVVSKGFLYTRQTK